MGKAKRGSPEVDKEISKKAAELASLVEKNGHQLGLKTLSEVGCAAFKILAVKTKRDYARIKQPTAMPGGARRKSAKSIP